ncbi:MAG: hypothetical protein RL032_732 [Pseudomonadota bacterium]|jgi:hypothetical protein
MGPFDLLNHLLNLVAPALVVGVVVAYAAPVFNRNWAVARVQYAQAAINMVAGMVALLAGLVFFGRDGKMASYGLMVLLIASAQWFSARGWK